MIKDEDIYTIPFRNDSGEAIPPFAVMRKSSVIVSREGEWVQPVGKPNATFDRLYLINGQFTIPVDGYGMAADGRSYPVLVKIDTDSADLAGGWGVTSGSWSLRKNRPGNFTCKGPSHDGVALFDQAYCDAVMGQLTGILTAGGTQTINLTYGIPATTEGAIQVGIQDQIMLAGKQLADDTVVKASWVFGVWYLDWWVGECSEDTPPEE